MDPRSINLASRRNLGFFLTTNRDSDTNREEHQLFATVSRACTDLLRQRRLRSSNILDHLETLDDVTNDLAARIVAEAKTVQATGFEDLKTTAGARAYASLLICASLSRYANLMEKRVRDKTSKQND